MTKLNYHRKHQKLTLNVPKVLLTKIEAKIKKEGFNMVGLKPYCVYLLKKAMEKKK